MKISIRLTPLFLVPLVAAQQPLPLEEAVRLALTTHPAMSATRAGEKEAETGVRLAAAGAKPRVSLSESYLRSNNPVFVFGSLLNQRQFRAANFELDRLNNPSSLTNFLGQARIEQVLFDANRTRRAIEAARLQRDLSAEERRSAEANVILGVVRTYFGVALAAESVKIAEESLRTAQADLKRAEAMVETGMSTRAGVLSVQVHLAAVEEQRIRAVNELAVARAAFNDALGLDLDREHDLTTALGVALPAAQPLEGYERLAVAQKPEVKKAGLQTALSEARVKQARSALWPRLVAQGVLEGDRQRFATRAGGNWLAGLSLQWDAWDGGANRAQVALAELAKERAEAIEKQAHSAALLDIRRAHAALQSAAQRLAVSEAAIRQAAEGHRIVQDRYENGLENVTELLRSETALAEARFRRLAALYDQRIAAAALEHAAGSLTPASEVLR
jgi:outer membrane protein